MLAFEPRFDANGFLGSGLWAADRGEGGLRVEGFSVIVFRLVLEVLREMVFGDLAGVMLGVDLGWLGVGLSWLGAGVAWGVVGKGLESFGTLRGLALGIWELDVGWGCDGVWSGFFFGGISMAFFDPWRLLCSCFCCCWPARSGPLFLLGGDLRKSWPLLVKNPPLPALLPGI